MEKDDLTLWVKRCEIKALRRSHAIPANIESNDRSYFQGKAAAFAEIWAMLVFNGEYTAEEYTKANVEWLKRLKT